MTPPRTPVVLGAGPGVGASTVAAALHAHDGGCRDAAADVVVCTAEEESLRRAEMLAVGGARPLLAVVLLHAGPAPAPPRLRLAARRYAGVTVLPRVAAWSGRGGPGDDVAVLLGERPDQLPPGPRAYAAALRAVAASLLGSGLLDRPRPPVVAIPGSERGLPPPVPLPRPAPPPARRPVRFTPIDSGVRPASRATAAGSGDLLAARADRPGSGDLPAPPTVAGRPPLPRIVLPSRPLVAPARTDLDDLDDEALEQAVALLGTR